MNFMKKSTLSVFVLAMTLALCGISLSTTYAAGTPHIVYGYVKNSDSSTPTSGIISFEVYISGRTTAKLTQASTGCGYSKGLWWAEVGNFPTPWAIGETFHISLTHTGINKTTTGEITLNGKGSQMMSDLIIPPSDSGGGDSGGGTKSPEGSDGDSSTNCFIDTTIGGQNKILSGFAWIGIFFMTLLLMCKATLHSGIQVCKATLHSGKIKILAILFFQLAFMIGLPCTGFAGSQTFTLKTGWNGISIPYTETQIANAEGLINAIPNCTVVRYWDASQQRYIEHSKGSTENNFTVISGKPYFVSVTSDTSWQITGITSAYTSTSLMTTGSTSINAVSIPLTRSDLLNAEELAKEIPNCDTVWYWDAAKGGYVGHPKGLEINNFSITPGSAYLVSVTQSSTWSHTPSSVDTDDDSDGYTENQGDCNDSNAAIHPGATEICNDNLDNDCDSTTDCADADCASNAACQPCTDADADGYFKQSGCGTAVDCNDTDKTVHPGAAELCNDAKDNDCDTKIDCADSNCSENTVCQSCTDADADGYFKESGCGTALDCNDTNNAIHPGMTEICNDNLDNDCDTLIDCADPNCSGNAACQSCTDADADGYFKESGCGTAVDCNDANNSIHPGALEVCNDTLDNDCDTKFDCNDPDCSGNTGCQVCTDADADGYYRENGCGTALDCNDSSADIHPGATDTCEDGIDQDCDGSDATCPVGPEDQDDDGDGFTEKENDCDDSNPNIHPGATDVCEDGIDQDCDGSDAICPVNPNDTDDDGDGYTEDEGDCNDESSAIHPGATEICGDGIDQDCDNKDSDCIEDDDDGDGYTEADGDCNDSNPQIYPGATEICGDNIDQDCDNKDTECPSDMKEGVFTDSPVQGLRYKTATQAGVTDAAGIFRYKEGENILFYVGDILLGNAVAKSVMTPLDLVYGADETDSEVVNICRFLQTLDDDDYPDNGILINSAVREAAVGKSLNFKLSATDFENDSSVREIIETLTTLRSSGKRTLVSAEDASARLHHLLYEVDKDGDGYTVNQGDCNDANHGIHPSATEICGDGTDQDCDGNDLPCENEYPVILSTVPAKNVTDAGVNTKIIVNFSTEMDTDSFKEDTFYVQTGEGYSLKTISGTISCSGKTATFHSNSLLNNITLYRVTVTEDVKSIYGYSLGYDYTWSFTTSVTGPGTSPEITSTIPVSNATDVNKNVTIRVTFSSDMNPESVNASTFYVRTGTGYNVRTLSGTISCTGVIATFKPETSLDANTAYTVTITSGVESLNGDFLTSDYKWVFRTGENDPADNDGDGYTEEQGDCNDNNAAIHPDAAESCIDNQDNDCDNLIDCLDSDCEENAACQTVCTDSDSDGYYAQSNCGTAIDCNDANVAIHPGAVESCSDNQDNDCDGDVDCDDSECADNTACQICTDADADGYYAEANCTTAIDCNDADAAIYPDMTEICDDNKDNNCNGNIDCNDSTCVNDAVCQTPCNDADADGYFAKENCGTAIDCNDADASIHPASAEICNDEKDNDCNGDTDCDDSACADDAACQVSSCTDADVDGYFAEYGCGTAIDCNDTDAEIYPNAPETCEDMIDQDCDGSDLSCSTPPAILSLLPDNNAVNVDVKTPITVNFSQSVDALSVTEDTFYVQTGTEYNIRTIEGIIACNGSTATFTPNDTLDLETTYRVTLTSNVKNTGGISLESDVTWQFTTWEKYPGEEPEIISAEPANNETDVSVNTEVQVLFSEPMDPDTINADTFYVYTGSEYDLRTVQGTISYNDNKAIFSPAESLDYTTVYNVVVTKYVRASTGISIASDITWIFTTGTYDDEHTDDDEDGYTVEQGDCNDNDANIHPCALETCGDETDQDCNGTDLLCSVSPLVISIFPSKNDVGVDVNSSISVCFSQAMDAQSINSDTFYVSMGVEYGYQIITGEIVYENDIAKFLPDAPLSYGKTYTVTLTKAVQNPGETSLAHDFVWSFQAGYEADVDKDGDGYTATQGDCNDEDSSIYPGASEICNDGIDQDCDSVDPPCVIYPDDPGECLTTNESELSALLNEFRKINGLSELLISKSLTRVAQWHVADLNENYSSACPNLHSWSDQHPDIWNSVCYTAYQRPDSVSWSKPRELTSNAYSGNGYEWAYQYCDQSVSGLFEVFKQTPEFQEIVLETGAWSGMDWRSAGFGIYEGTPSYVVIWFGTEVDNQGAVKECASPGADPDNDKDGYTVGQGDCNDNDAAIHPGAIEICYDSKDNDCDNLTDCNDSSCYGSYPCYQPPTCTDADGDGYYAQSGCGTVVDCNDGNAGIHPGATEICNDGVDQDCDGNDSLCFKVTQTTVTIAPEGIERVMIEGGNPPYSVSSPDTAVATIELNEDAITVTGVAEGETSFTVSDSGSESQVVMVTVGQIKTYSNTLGMTFKHIPAGTFMMGSPADELGREDDEVLHEVILHQDYYMQITEVTQTQWKAVMGSNPSYFPECGEDCPVENVSWNDVQEFITQLNGLGEGIYRLPTEAEWEYAARAGSDKAFANGDISVAPSSCDNDPNLDAIGFYCGNSCVSYSGGYDCSATSPCSTCGTNPVSQKSPNDFGLYDMHGNISEWCQDWYGDYPAESVSDPDGSDTGTERVVRGGSWVDDAGSCRSANRNKEIPDVQDGGTGFRLVMILSEAK